MHRNRLSYLALGDSYTIGETVPIYESFPYQFVQKLRMKGVLVNAPEILAKTGWTTDELEEGISRTRFLDSYDMVTLLIGVNNQYRGRATENFAVEFERLLNRAISFARERRERVLVLSIPDWGATPFAEGRDRKKIGEEIDAYNSICRAITQRFEVFFVDITEGSREATVRKELVANDGLHPSGIEYERWADAIAAYFSFQ